MRILIFTLTLCLQLSLFQGCTTTITPDPVVSSQPSFDNGEQNSGFLKFNEDGSGVITPHARDRYNALINIYGTSFLIPITKDAGLIRQEDGTYIIIAESLVKFATMNRWYKSGRVPGDLKGVN